jgi:hypothetical protein
MNLNNSHPAPSQADEALALALQARAAIETWKRALAERGLTPEACLEDVRRSGGDTAVAQVQDKVAGTLRALDDKADREAMHCATPPSAVARRVARRDIV